MSTSKNKSLFIVSTSKRYWIRVYQRKNRYFALSNFPPSSFPAFTNDMEHFTHLSRLTNYPDTNMGVYEFTVTRGLPLYDLQNSINKLDTLMPLPLTHNAYENEKLDA